MFSFSPPSPAAAAAQSMLPAPVGGFTDYVALGCESADPALQIALWGHEIDDGGQASAVVTS